MMQVSITTLTRRRNGSLGRKEDIKGCEVLRIGRGADNEIFLLDHRVPLHLAELHEGADGLFIEANGTNDLRLNGAIIRKAHLNVGDVVGIGPYELVVADPEDGINIAVTLELVHPIGDDVEALLLRSTLTTNNIGLSKRASSWIFGSLTLILFLALPLFMADNPLSNYFNAPTSDKNSHSMVNSNDIDFDVSWVSGEVMNSHKFFANDCAACHTKAFVMVEDAACTACHTKQHGHIDKVKFPSKELTSTRCATCHTDHQGPHPVRAAKQALCSDCHNDLDTKVEGMHLANVSDFATNHPQFNQQSGKTRVREFKNV